MITLIDAGFRLVPIALAMTLGISVCFAPSATAADGEPECAACGAKAGRTHLLSHRARGVGTLGYGPPGLFPGFQGFGLGYHLGYGYGGQALGVGADGGYPCYGGPGYPHPWPTVRRIGGITPFYQCGIMPFLYYGGPGYPTPDQPNYFGEPGPRVSDRPVITIGNDYGDVDHATGYGFFTGGPPNPEARFAAFTLSAAAGGSFSGVITSDPSSAPPASPPAAGLSPPSASIPPAPSGNTSPPPPRRYLGIDAETVVDAGGVKGLQVTKVYPASAAEKAGLHVGDVIHSINGYRTEQAANVAWIIGNAAPGNALNMNVRTASDGKDHSITAELP